VEQVPLWLKSHSDPPALEARKRRRRVGSSLYEKPVTPVTPESPPPQKHIEFSEFKTVQVGLGVFVQSVIAVGVCVVGSLVMSTNATV
jgi:hypothetical protein